MWRLGSSEDVSEVPSVARGDFVLLPLEAGRECVRTDFLGEESGRRVRVAGSLSGAERQSQVLTNLSWLGTTTGPLYTDLRKSKF